MIDLAIIGAGPYGLSLAAHVRSAGVSYRVFGKVMEAWKHKMPPGMLLKSHPWSSCLYDPEGRMTFEAYSRQAGVSYHPSLTETPVDLYGRYGEAFQKTLGLDVVEKKAVNLTTAPGGFRIVFDDGEVVSARRVVLAVGVHAFSHVPPVLAGLPPEALSHSGDYGPLEGLDRREVVVVGSGASAIDLVTLLHERGVTVSLLSRASKLHFAGRPAASGRSLLRRLARPDSGIGAGWVLWAYANAPQLFHRLPGPLRRHIVRNTLGPLGGASMKARMIGKVPLLLGWELEGADHVGGRVELNIRKRGGAGHIVTADHVVAATGYRIDMERLSFLDASLKRRIRTAAGAPVLSQDYETSVPGLYVIGPASADSFGPVARFVFGAVHPARRLARRFSSDLARKADVPEREAAHVAA